MSNDPKEKEKSSTSSIVMRALDATTFSELQAFTKDLEARPIERLLRDLVDLVQPSESKAQIVSYVMATKFRRADAGERKRILESLDATLERLEEGEVRERVNFVAERIRGLTKAGG
jgi:hypothetical protein